MNKLHGIQFCTFLFLLMIGQSVFAQQIEWSKPYEMSSAFNTNEVFHSSEEGFYVVQKYKDKDYYFQRKLVHYNKQFETTEGTENFDLSYQGVKARYQFGISVQGEPYFCYWANDIDKQHASFLIDALEVDSIRGNHNPISLFEVDYTDKIYDNEGFRCLPSEDQSKWLFYTKRPYSKKEKAEIEIHIGSPDFKEFTTGIATLSGEASMWSIEDVVDAIVDNQGNAYLLSKGYKTKVKKEEKKKGTRFVYSLVKMDKEGNVKILDTLKVLEPKDSAIIVSAKLSLNKKTNMVSCIGTFKTPRGQVAILKYSLETDDWSRSNGVVISYPQKFVEKTAASRREIKKKKKLGLENYKIKTIIEQDNGDKIVFAEQQYTKVFVDKSEGRQELHRLNNIYVAKLLASDSIEWISLLVKRQTAGANGYTDLPRKLYSFSAFQKDSTVHILYNELESNLAIEEELKLKAVDFNSPKDCGVVHCGLNANSGSILYRKSLSQLKDNGVAIYPKAAILQEDNSLLLLGMKPEQGTKKSAYYRFGRLQLTMNNK
jgi:hypothetical protein